MAQPTYEITFHAVNLDRHGLNPYGQPVYRVVWADSRLTKVMHRGKVVTLPRYMHGDESAACGHWILEKWVQGEIVLGMTREQYREFLAQFPNAAAEEFPEKGDYELSLVFPNMVDEAALHLHLDRKEHIFRSMSNADRKLNVELQEDAKEQAEADAIDALYDKAREMTIQ